MVADDVHPGALALAGQLDAALDASDPGEGSAWRRGWVLAALGRYGEAFDALDAAEKEGRPAVAGAACATRASVLRAVGLHFRAEAEGRRGLVLLEAQPCPDVRSGLLIGLVADEVQRGTTGEALDATLRAASEAVTEGVSLRQRIRLDWATGDVARARGHALAAAPWYQRARRRAVDGGLARHAAKSLVLLAAASTAAGDRARGRDQAREALEMATRCGAEPLRGQALTVLAEGASPGDPAAADDVLAALAARLPLRHLRLRGA